MIDKPPQQGLHMPSETNALALRSVPPASSEDDYRAFCAALTSSARGRAFLEQYARRNRSADTQVLLDALARLEAHIRADRSAANTLRDQLRMLLIAIRLARPEIAAAAAPARATKLRELLDMLERRIDLIAESKLEPAAARSAPQQGEIETARARLAVVPPPDEPELPIPQPAAPPPAIVLVGTAAIMASPFDNAPAAAAYAKAAPAAASLAAAPTPAPLRADPLQALMALSEDERLALFT
jgi:hypothetical protein